MARLRSPATRPEGTSAGGRGAAPLGPEPRAAGPRTARLGRTLLGYIVTELVRPTLIALTGLTVAALTKNLLGFADLIVNRGLGADAVAAIALYQLVPMSTRVLPFAVLVGALVGLGRLNADREILILESSGLAPVSLLKPVLFFAAAMTVADLGLSLVTAPWSKRELQTALAQMSREHPGAALHAGIVHNFGDRRLVAREVSSRGDRLRGVLLWMPDLGETVFAKRGSVDPIDRGRLEITLEEGTILLSPGKRLERVRFESLRTTLRDPSELLMQTEDDRMESASLAKLLTFHDSEQTDRNQVRMVQAELQRRFALPMATLLFGLLTVPLAFSGRRFSRQTGALAGLIVTIGYYGLVQLGNGMLRYEQVPVALAIWLPNAVMGGLLVWLLMGTRIGTSVGHEHSPWSRRRKVSPRTSVVALKSAGRRRLLLERYVLARYLQMALLSFAILLAGYLLIDVLERLEWFARYHADPLEALRFYGARIPLLASRVVPMSLLAASSLAVSLLALHGELVAMQACGIGLGRGLAPIVVVSALLVPADFVLNDTVVPRSNALADEIKVTEIKGRSPWVDASSAVWYRVGNRVLRAAQLDRKLGQARDLTIYEFDASGLPRSRTDAREARPLGKGLWRLIGAKRVEISGRGLASAEPPETAQLGDADPTPLDTMHLSVGSLLREIRSAETSGYDATGYRVDLHRKLAAPTACLFLPLVAILYAMGIRGRFGPARTLLVSFGLGVGYLLLGDIAASLGYGGRLPPAAAGWAPPVLLGALCAVFVLRRSSPKAVHSVS